MEDYKLTEKQKSGFSFENCLRNNYLEKNGYEVPKPFKTGTTIVGVIFNGGVVLGADTRATDDTTVADKNCSKIHYLQPNIYCCGAGTAADTEQVTGMVSSNMELHRLYTRRVVPVVTACRMLKQFLFRYQGHIGAALVLGGVDATGPHLYSVAPHGSTDKVPYTTMGSGSLAAMAVLESGWYKDIEEEAAKELVCAAITSGILNDLGSGSNVDLCVIKKDYSVDYIRPYKEISVKGKRIGDYQFPIGTTKLIAPPILVELKIEDESVVSVARESMDTS